MKTTSHVAEEGQADLVDLFLQEMKARRERLACWMQLLEEELGEGWSGAGPSRHRCSGKAAGVRTERKS